MRHAGAQRAREGECLGASGVKARVLRELARRSGRNWAETSACVRQAACGARKQGRGRGGGEAHRILKRLVCVQRVRALEKAKRSPETAAPKKGYKTRVTSPLTTLDGAYVCTCMQSAATYVYDT